MKKYYIVFVIIGIALVYGCRGTNQDDLVGYWEQIPYTNPEDPVATPVKIFWKFYSGDKVTIILDKNGVLDSLQYTYGVNASVLDILSGVDDGEYLVAARDPRGQYWVDMLNSSQLKATKRKHPDGTTGAVFMRIELVKR